MKCKTNKQYILTVSIVTYRNDENELLKAVNSVLNSKDVNLKLYIVDNSPNDNLRRLFDDPRVEYIYNNKNIGFGAAHNITMRKGIEESKYHLCLNPDICFDSDVLHKIVSYMDQNKSVGQLLPKIKDGEGVFQCKQRRLLPIPFMTFFRNIFKNTSYTKRKSFLYYTRFKSYDEEMASPFLSGCFVFLRCSTLRKVGLFDERFFMYYEDADLSRRIYSYTGNMYWPEVTITHIGHMDSHKSWKVAKIHIASAIKYYNKWGWFEKDRRRINSDVIRINSQQ